MANSLVVAAVGTVPVVFYRGVLDSFDLTKATLLWTTGVSLLAFLICKGRESLRGPEAIVGVALLAAMSVVTITSFRPWSSFFGQYQRYSGLLTYLSAISIFVVISTRFDHRWRLRLVLALRIAAVFCASYVIAQSLGLDPWEWSSPGQNKPLFGTMGNINTSAGLLGILAPLFLVDVMSGKSKLRRASAAMVFLLIGAAIGLNESFQGNVAGLASLSVLVVASARSQSNLQSARLLLVAFVYIVSGLMTNSNQRLVLIVGVAAVVSALFLIGDDSRDIEGIESGLARSRLFQVGGSLLAAIAFFFVAFGDRLIREFQGGMVERAAFYRSALKLWSDRPILGWGPETFGYLFSIHRPEWHAVVYEGNRPSSAHSIPLGILVSGGIVLFAMFVIFVVSVFRYGSGGLRTEQSATFSLRVCLLAAFGAAVVQGSVSVEHVALVTVFFALAGLLCSSARLREGSLNEKSGRVRSSSYDRAVLLAMLATPLVLLPQISRPFRADFSVRQGLEAAYQDGDLDKGVEKMRSAVRMAPWDPQQRLRLVSLLQSKGDAQLLAPEAIRLSEMFNCLPSVSVGAAYAAAAVGDFSKALEISRCTLAHDPYSRLVRQAIAELFAQMAEASLSASKLDVAAQFASDSLDLDPANARARAVSGSLSATTSP